MARYRKMREELVDDYEKRFGKYIVTLSDVPDDAEHWQWIDGPWPWDNDFMEG